MDHAPIISSARLTGLPPETERGISLAGRAKEALARAAAPVMGCGWESVRLEPIYRGAMPDSPEIFSAQSAESSRQVAVMLSPLAAPQFVKEANGRATAAARLLGPSLSRSVVQPLAIGEACGRSYAIVPFLNELADAKLAWWLQRRQIAPALLEWLHGVVVQTRREMDYASIRTRYVGPLEAIAHAADIAPQIRAKADGALRRLYHRAWHPADCLMHGDFWPGNVMLRPRVARETWAERLVIIDWAGSRVNGYPLFDLLRATQALRVGRGGKRREVQRHCASLNCDLVDSWGYVLAAFGALSLEPGFFSRRNLLSSLELACSELASALNGAPITTILQTPPTAGQRRQTRNHDAIF